MSVCVLIAGKAATCLAGVLFSLSWTHSVEKTQWIEHWRVIQSSHAPALSLEFTKIKGSGAGIDPAPHAQLVEGWYQWQPVQALIVPHLSLANSEQTPDNWTLCTLAEESGQAGECVVFADFATHKAREFRLVPN
jgi:hypothetical protein